MSPLGSRRLRFIRNTFFASAFATAGVGCTVGEYAGTAVVDGPPEDDGDVVYVPAPPVAEIETYPAVPYGGVSAYYVDGRWYRQGPRGWAYYRQEPSALARHREEHWARDHDARWAARPLPPGRAQDPRIAPPRPGVTEMQPEDRRVEPEPRRETRARPASEASRTTAAPRPVARPTLDPRQAGPGASAFAPVIDLRLADSASNERDAASERVLEEAERSSKALREGTEPPKAGPRFGPRSP